MKWFDEKSSVAGQVGAVRILHLEDSAPDADKDHRIFLRADRAVPYGEMMSVLEILRAGGYTKIALVALEAAPEAAK